MPNRKISPSGFTVQAGEPRSPNRSRRITISTRSEKKYHLLILPIYIAVFTGIHVYLLSPCLLRAPPYRRGLYDTWNPGCRHPSEIRRVLVVWYGCLGVILRCKVLSDSASISISSGLSL